MRKVYAYQKLFSYFIMASCLFLWACGERPMGQKEELAIQIIKGYSTEDGFSIISNIQKRRDTADRAGNPWTMGPWEAGLLSQGDRNQRRTQPIFQYLRGSGRPVGPLYIHRQGWDSRGALGDAYLQEDVEGKNDLAKEFMTSSE